MIRLFRVALLSMSLITQGSSAGENPLLEAVSQHAVTNPTDPARRLASFLEGLDPVRLGFKQTVFGARGQVLERSEGEFLLLRPRFRWTVAEPFPQDIVADGELLQIYDPDLEQVTQQSVTDALKGTPLGLLSRQQVDLAEQFQVQRRNLDPARPQLEVYELRSLDDAAPYHSVTISIEQGLRRIELVDPLDQRLLIDFSPLPGGAPQEADFKLDLPPDTDIIHG